MEKLLQNVEDNELGNDEDVVGDIKEMVAKMYNMYIHARTLPAKELRELAAKTEIPLKTLKHWRHEPYIPITLLPYIDSLLPQSEQQRKAFVYLLGIAGRNYSTLERRTNRIQRTFSDVKARNRFVDAVHTTLGEKPPVKRLKVTLQNNRLVRILGHCLEEKLNQYVKTDDDRVLFLQGFFDASLIHLYDIRGKDFYYKLVLTNKDDRDRFLNMLFELEIYPKVNERNGNVMIIGYQDLQRMFALGLDRNPNNRTVVKAELEKGPQSRDRYTPQRYYAVRKAVAEYLEDSEAKISWKVIAKEFGLATPSTVPRWCVDLIVEKRGPYGESLRIPDIVKRYEQLFEILGLENIYTGQKPIRRNGKVFFPINGKAYVLPYETQQQYLKLFQDTETDHHELTDQDIVDLQEELILTLGKATKPKYLEMIIEHDVITKITLARTKKSAPPKEKKKTNNTNKKSPFEINYNGTTYYLPRTQWRSYRSAYDLDSLTTPDQDVIQHFITAIGNYRSGVKDENFSVTVDEGRIISGMKIK